MNCKETCTEEKLRAKALEYLRGEDKEKEEEARDTGRMVRQEGKEPRNAGFHRCQERRDTSEVKG